MRQSAGPHEAGDVAPEDAAARRPLCVLTLVRVGLLDEEVMKPTFETYIQHLPEFGREARKALMHAGKHTQGSHYLLYDYSTAAEALRASDTDTVETETHGTVRAAILREMALCHNTDGSFVDNPIIGTATRHGIGDPRAARSDRRSERLGRSGEPFFLGTWLSFWRESKTL